MYNAERSHPYSGLTARAIKRVLTEQFRAANIAFPDNDALELVMSAAGLDAAELILQEAYPLPSDICQKISDYAQRRLSGEPVDHILGWREFYGRRFSISQNVLSPRADTEILITHALANLKARQAPNILDLGTGSGAILITLLAERPDAVGIGVDISQAALDIARDNAKTLNVSRRADWLCGHWFAPLHANMQFDMIISNPPYITSAAMENLQSEVKDYDPHIALQGGPDGLEAYRQILNTAQTWLKPGGWIGFEIGFDQKITVGALLENAGFVDVQSHKDISGHDRVLCAFNEIITKS